MLQSEHRVKGTAMSQVSTCEKPPLKEPCKVQITPEGKKKPTKEVPPGILDL